MNALPVSLKSPTTANRKARHSCLLACAVSEILESRLLLANWYVATTGNDLSGLGTLEQPYRTVQKGMNVAVAGDTVLIRGGIYREQLYVNAGHSGALVNGQPQYVTLAAYNGESPDIRGASAVSGWTVYSGNIWRKTGWAHKSQQVFDDGVPLQQIGMPGYAYTSAQYIPVGSGLGNMLPGRFYYDQAVSTLYVQLPDDSNPNNSLMEASVGTNNGRTFMAEATRGYMRLQGLTFQYSNTSATMEQGAMVNLGSNSIAENSVFKNADFSGLSLGWPTSNVQVINSQFINNGDSGILGAGSSNYYIGGNSLSGNNYRHFSTQWHAGGIKIASGAYGIVENNDVGTSYGSGIWFDYANSLQPTIIRNNYIHDNGPNEAGIFFEASANGQIYNNVLVNNNRRGIYVSGSSNVKVYNNTVVGQKGLSAIEVLPRTGVNSTDTLVKNNTISGGTSNVDLYMSQGAGNYSDYNNIYRAGTPSLRLSYYGTPYTSLATWRNATGFDMNSLNASPGFVGASADDYRLARSSTLVNAGTTLSEVSADYAGALRPSGAAYDIGAYEYVYASVAGHHLFYNNSYFDGNNPTATAQDDSAIASDKHALLAGETASFANYTSYSRGINGIMVDVTGLPGSSLMAGDFTSLVGNTSTPSSWAVGPAPSSIAVRTGAGINGSDRVTLIWADNAIQKQWLQITMLVNVNTGLATPDVFYFGNALGDSGNSTSDAIVDATDQIGARNNSRGSRNRAPIDFAWDYNRDGLVNATDEIIARNNVTGSRSALNLIAPSASSALGTFATLLLGGNEQSPTILKANSRLLLA